MEQAMEAAISMKEVIASGLIDLARHRYLTNHQMLGTRRRVSDAPHHRYGANGPCLATLATPAFPCENPEHHFHSSSAGHLDPDDLDLSTNPQEGRRGQLANVLIRMDQHRSEGYHHCMHSYSRSASQMLVNFPFSNEKKLKSNSDPVS